MFDRAKFWRYLRFAFLTLALLAAGFTLYLDIRVRSEFEGRRFALPARIYARPLELHAGLRIAQIDVVRELQEAGYGQGPREGDPGWFANDNDWLEIAVRPFVFWDGLQPAKRVRVAFDSGVVKAVQDAEGRELPFARLEPLAIGGIYPANNEDRVLVRLSEVPKHADAAAGEEFLPHPRAHALAQGHRALHGGAARDALRQGRDPRDISERNLPRPGPRPRHPRRGPRLALLLRQDGRAPHVRRERAPRRHGEGPGLLRPVPQPAASARAPQPRPARDQGPGIRNDGGVLEGARRGPGRQPESRDGHLAPPGLPRSRAPAVAARLRRSRPALGRPAGLHHARPARAASGGAGARAQD